MEIPFAQPRCLRVTLPSPKPFRSHSPLRDAETLASWHGPYDPQFGALPITPRLPYERDRFDGILVAIDVQVGKMGRLNKFFVSSHRVIDSVTFLLRMILTKMSHVNELG